MAPVEYVIVSISRSRPVARVVETVAETMIEPWWLAFKLLLTLMWQGDSVDNAVVVCVVVFTKIEDFETELVKWCFYLFEP